MCFFQLEAFVNFVKISCAKTAFQTLRDQVVLGAENGLKIRFCQVSRSNEILFFCSKRYQNHTNWDREKYQNKLSSRFFYSTITNYKLNVRAFQLVCCGLEICLRVLLKRNSKSFSYRGNPRSLSTPTLIQLKYTSTP